MTEPLPLVSDATLREIAESSSLELAICASPSWRDIRSIAAELVEARAEVKRLREDINVEALNEDCWALIRAVGLPDHARPTSCHRVVVDEIIPAIERLRKERDEFLEGIHVMLKLCGGSEDIDTLERQVKECGTKPSMFVAERIALAKKLLDSIAVVELAWERGEDWRDQRLAVWAMSGLADDLRQKLTQPLPGERRDAAKEAK